MSSFNWDPGIIKPIIKAGGLGDEVNLDNDIFIWTVAELLRFLRVTSPSLVTCSVNDNARKIK